MKKLIHSLILGLVLLAFGQAHANGEDIPTPPDFIPTPAPTVTPAPYQYQVPKALPDGWPVGDLRGEKVDLSKITQALDDIHHNFLGPMHGLLVLRHGKLMLEEYFNGYDASVPHPLNSCTKSVFSTVFGIARDQGLLSLDQKLYDLYPGRRSKPGWNPRKAGITLRNLLSMTSGLDCNDVGVGDANCGAVMARSKDWLEFCFNLPVAQDPGKAWMYNGCCLCLVSNLITQKSGMGFFDYANKVLLEPLGIKENNWVTGLNGISRVDYGLEWKPRDMAKLGQLYLNKGLWKGKRIVSPAWIEAATSVQAPEGEAFGHDYGYLWHLKNMTYQGRTVRVFYANGYGGQDIFVSPEADLVCVMTAGARDQAIYSMEEGLFEGRILGAFQ